LKTKNPLTKTQIITLGCSKNKVDSEVLAGLLSVSGVPVVHRDDIEPGGIVLINTCGFIRDAKQESVDTILRILEAKREGRISKVFVMGCLVQRYSCDLKKELPDVDGFFGVNDQEKIARTLGVRTHQELLGERVLSTPSHYAYMKIAEGCDHRCSFCAIPLIRGRHVSRSPQDLLDEAVKLSDRGVRELILISQDLTWYGMDTHGKRMLPDLVKQLAALGKFDWIRLHYTYPAGFPYELLDVIAENKSICRYIDIPLQHISNRILRSMKRGTTREDTLKLLDTIRRKLPGAAVRTTLITGYPGETESEFTELLEFIRSHPFERLGVFTYSDEEGTAACGLKSKIRPSVKAKRLEMLMRAQQDISLRINRQKVGKTLRVLVDREEGDYFGRTEIDSPEVDNEVVIRKKYGKKLVPGRFYDLRITGAGPYDLYAEV
jgi:ribosomal protein S12 methylthiotransferase